MGRHTAYLALLSPITTWGILGKVMRERRRDGTLACVGRLIFTSSSVCVFRTLHAVFHPPLTVAAGGQAGALSRDGSVPSLHVERAWHA